MSQKKGKWAMDFTAESTTKTAGGVVSTKSSSFAKPPGYSDAGNYEVDEARGSKKKEDQMILKQKKARELAWSPAKSFFMTGLMLWMSGNGVHIFSIMITFYAIFNPVKACFGVNNVFARFDDGKTDLMLNKMLYVVCNIVSASIALYKMSCMGLLPTTPADWIAYHLVKPAVEISSGGVPLS